MKSLSIGFCAIFTLVFGPSSVSAQVAETNYVPGEVLVVFKPGIAKSSRDTVLTNMGCRVIREYPNLDIVQVSTVSGKSEVQTANQLRLDPRVEGASPNFIRPAIGHLTTPNDPSYAQQWGLNNTGINLVGAPPPMGGFANPVGIIDADIDAPQGWVHTTNCQGLVVAVLDTGTDLGHPDFGGNAPGGNLWTNPGEIAGNGIDDDVNGVVDDVNGINVGAYEMYSIRPPAHNVYATGDWIVLDNDSSRTISVGDMRLTATAGGAAGSVVGAGNADVGATLTDFDSWVVPVAGANPNTPILIRHVEFVVDGRYNNGEWVIRDNDASGTISVGDQRLDATVGGAAGTVVAAVDPDVGLGLINFVRVPNAAVNDFDGHGTDCASVIGAMGNNGIDIAGVCWRALILTVKAGRQVPGNANMSDADQIAGISYLIGLRIRAVNPVNVRIMNVSYGGPSFSSALRSAINAAGAAGILYTTAAGNNAVDNDGGPEAIYRDVDTSGTVTAGDIRLNGIRIGVSYFENSTVAAADGDAAAVLTLAAFNANERHADPDASANYTPGEAIYQDVDASGTVTAGDVRLTLVSAAPNQYGYARIKTGTGLLETGSGLVVAGDTDIGTALIAFNANERHLSLNNVPNPPGPNISNGLLDPFNGNLPCAYDLPSTLCVAASDVLDNLASFSCWGRRSVDLAAPGEDLLMLRLVANGGGTHFNSGTSFAAPMVAGISAHFWSLPSFAAHTIAQLKTRLMTGTNGPVGTPHPHGVDPRWGLRGAVVSGLTALTGDGRARLTSGDDFGDAPDPKYPTKLSTGVPAMRKGARHEDIGEEWLGKSADVYPVAFSCVSPEFDATNNPALWPNDPDGVPNLVDNDACDDGVDLFGPFNFSDIPPALPVIAQVDVYVDTENNTALDLDGGRYGGGHAAGDGVHRPGDSKLIWVNGFFDWNGDGDWDDANEHVFMLRVDPSAFIPASGGKYTILFNMPTAPVPDPMPVYYARFRLDYGENLGQGVGAFPPHAVGPSAGGRVKFWDDLGGLPFVPGAGAARRYESIPAGNQEFLDLTYGLAQFGEVEDYPFTPNSESYPCPNNCPGDMNLDLTLNGLDIAGFIDCLFSGPGVDCGCADINGDTSITQADIPVFVNRLLTKAPCIP